VSMQCGNPVGNVLLVS